MRRITLTALAAAGLLVAISPRAWAEGGSHVVDDSKVEDAGHCHLEVWLSRISTRAGLLNLGPACTYRRFPDLEFGAFFQPSRSTGASAAGAPGPFSANASTDVFLGPALKYTFRHDSSGLGVGLDAGFTYNATGRRMEAVSALVPVTFTAGPVRVNFNAGAQYVRADRAMESFLGAQAELPVGHDLTVMLEHFGRSRGYAGDQAGLRWTPRGRNFDVDLVAGRRIDGVSRRALSIGVTLRR